MIDERVIHDLLQRLAALDWYPKDNRHGINDLVSVLRTARTDAIAIDSVNVWIDDQPRCPRPSELRTLIESKNVGYDSQKAKCPNCDGCGFITVWQLVTYKGNSFLIDKREDLPGLDYASAMEFAAKLPDHQTVLSAARPCECATEYQAPATCRTCKGFGFYGGYLGTAYDGVWKLCACAAGDTEAQRKVDEANDARAKLILRFGTKPVTAIIQQQADDYHGEF